MVAMFAEDNTTLCCPIQLKLRMFDHAIDMNYAEILETTVEILHAHDCLQIYWKICLPYMPEEAIMSCRQAIFC